MKKNLFYAFAGAIALSGAVGLSSCSSSSDEVVSNNPDYNPEQNSVKAQFTISFQNNVARANTRQSGATVQKDENIDAFRGMEDIVLYPFGVAGTITSDHKKLGGAITLKKIIKPSEANVDNSIPPSTLTNVSNSVLYNDVTIPVGTSSFLFYGKAIDNGNDDFLNGSLAMTTGEPSAIKFDLVQTYPSSTTESTVGEALAIYLTNIAQAGGFNSTTKKSAWEATENAGLKDLYDKFVSLKAGSSRTVQAAVQDLYSTIKDNEDAVSLAIKTAITSNTYVSSIDEGVLKFTSTIGNSESTYFPGDKNLPDGAALLSYDEETNTFTQKTDGSDIFGTVPGTNPAKSRITSAYADYVYPASLYYYCNSGIKTSNSSQATAYNGTDSWATISGKYTDGTSVSTSTRSVAILNPIQYAVGRLDATVKLGGDATTLYDKNGEAYAVNTTDGFTVTGILIGGQKQVKYDFTTNTTADEYTIYDNITKSNGIIPAKSTTASAVNYTLALETEAGASVYVAVELLNNGADFQGIDGVVPAGCKFYLVGKLDPTTVPTTDTTNNPNGLTQVFKQDHKTIANFTIPTGYAKTDTAAGHFDPTTGNTVGLGKAYNTIPDLRSPKLELGLSVDLHWESGITFDVDF